MKPMTNFVRFVPVRFLDEEKKKNITYSRDVSSTHYNKTKRKKKKIFKKLKGKSL